MRCRSLIALTLLLLIGFSQPVEAKSDDMQEVKNPTNQNTDPNYRALRDAELTEGYIVEELTIKRDVGTITFKGGKVAFAPAIQGKVVLGVFTGEGEFSLTPVIDIEKRNMANYIKTSSVTEQFDRIVMVFSDKTYEEIKGRMKPGDVDLRAKETLKDWRNRMRRNTETPRSIVESYFSGEDVENVEANLLGYIYNSKRAEMFNAYIFGRKHNDLRFFVRPYGALPMMLSPEEVALVKYDPQGNDEGVWYLSHYESEWTAGTANSSEDKKLIDAEHYKLETKFKGERLDASCNITFKAIIDGERVIRFGLLPSLRVGKVTVNDKEISFIQENRKDDSAFYAVLAEPTVKDQKYTIHIEYNGNKVIEDAGGGNFAVSARTSWYPSLNSFNDYATFDTTFTTPNKFVLVGVGKKISESKEGDSLISQWKTDIPVAVNGFNYGRYKAKEVDDTAAKYKIEGYATSELPDNFKGAESIGGMSPTRLTENAIVEAQNSIRIFNHWFGEAPYGRIAITQQPQAFFGQSWPTLVYLPIISFFDSTQRWQMFGIQPGLTNFIDEVTSHEVAHQWWGHMVGWSTYHDQWLSEGFASFSAGLYLQYTQGGKLDKYLKYWENQRKEILEKNSFGFRPNDIGPIWMGQRLSTPRAPSTYQFVVYPKGAYILHMLRWMMYDRDTGDKRFKEMMHDFVKTHLYQTASTETFKAVVDKYMTPNMDLEGNKRMDWFFRQWVYGTEVPSYKFDYSLTPGEGGKTILKGTITQSGVSPGFKMLVPVYLDFDGKIVKLGSMGMVGNSTSSELSVPLPRKPKRAMINYHYDILTVDTINNGK